MNQELSPAERLHAIVTTQSRSRHRGEPIIASIKTRYADQILNGTKLWEYRRVAPANTPPYLLLIYSSRDDQAIVGHAEVQSHIEGTPKHVVAATIDETPQDRGDVLDYFNELDVAYALRVDGHRWSDPIGRRDLERQIGFQAPESFVYVDTVLEGGQNA